MMLSMDYIARRDFGAHFQTRQEASQLKESGNNKEQHGAAKRGAQEHGVVT
jgi:hypothetical protein